MQFYSGATGQAGRFSEGFCLRRVQSSMDVEVFISGKNVEPLVRDECANLSETILCMTCGLTTSDLESRVVGVAVAHVPDATSPAAANHSATTVCSVGVKGRAGSPDLEDRAGAAVVERADRRHKGCPQHLGGTGQDREHRRAAGSSCSRHMTPTSAGHRPPPAGARLGARPAPRLCDPPPVIPAKQTSRHRPPRARAFSGIHIEHHNPSSLPPIIAAGRPCPDSGKNTRERRCLVEPS